MERTIRWFIVYSSRHNSSHTNTQIESPQDRKKAHLEMERRYRHDLNTRLRQLHYLVPNLRPNYETHCGLDKVPKDFSSSLEPFFIQMGIPCEFADEAIASQFPNKAKILQKTVAYVKWQRGVEMEGGEADENALSALKDQINHQQAFNDSQRTLINGLEASLRIS